MELRRHLDPMPFELRNNRDVEAKQMLLPALAAGLVTLSMLLIMDLTNYLTWALVGCVLLFVVFCVFVWLRYGGRPVLAADNERLWIRLGATTFVGIAWAEVDDLRTTTREPHTYLLWEAPTAVGELSNSPKLWNTTRASRAAFDTPFVIGFTNKNHDRRHTVAELKRLAPEGTAVRAAKTG